VKAVVLTGIRQIETVDIPAPALKSDEDALLQIRMVGICGSDVHYYETGRIGNQIVQYPYIPGHECAATVKAVGRAVTDLKPGDTVAVDPAIPCGHCDQCNQGRKNTCRNLKFLGCPGQIPGCLSEYIVMPQQCLFPTHNRITLSQAVLCEPLSISLYAVKQANLSEISTIAILGAGPIGLGCLLCARAQKVKNCFVTEIIDERIEAAANNSAAWVGNPDVHNVVAEILNRVPTGVDVVFECAGTQQTIDQAIELLKPGGKLMLVGIPRTDSISLAVHQMRRKEITLINVRRQNNCTQSCIDLIASGKIKPDFMLTHRFKPQHAADAFDLVASYRDGVIKTLIEFES
jgi:L-iditol 2-dehydrogenase